MSTKRSALEDHCEEFYLCKKVNLVEDTSAVNGMALNTLNCNKKSTTDLIQLATEIQKADSFVHATACSKLQMIAEQIQFLQKQAQDVLLQVKTHLELHHVACNFVKVPGNVYHLYKRPSGQLYFSMLSPQEWGDHPHQFAGSYRLERDRSWTPLENIEKKDSEIVVLNKIMAASKQFNDCKSLHDGPMDV